MNTRTLSTQLADLALAAQALRQGELVALPTETVYGLAGNAFNPQAVLAIFEAKGRPHFDPLIVHVLEREIDQLERAGLLDSARLTLPLRQIAQALMDAFWPGPLTLVLPRNAARVPDLVTSGLDSVALRCPAHPVMRQVIELAEVPLAAPSANRFGRISPTQAAHVREELDGRIGWIVDGGASAIGIESTVLAIPHDNPQQVHVLRPGGLDTHRIAEVLKPHGATLVFQQQPLSSSPTTGASPGMLPSHYAPAKPLQLVGEIGDGWKAWPALTGVSQLGYLAFSGSEDAIRAQIAQRYPHMRGVHVQILSPKGQPQEAAHALFAKLRVLDDSAAETLLAQEVPEALRAQSGIALAIQDRLQRAAYRADSH